MFFAVLFSIFAVSSIYSMPLLGNDFDAAALAAEVASIKEALIKDTTGILLKAVQGKLRAEGVIVGDIGLTAEELGKVLDGLSLGFGANATSDGILTSAVKSAGTLASMYTNTCFQLKARDMIAKVYEFMKHEASSEYAEKLTNARWRCAHACGVSEKTVTRILKEKRKAVAAAAGGAAGAVAAGKVGLLENTGNAINETGHGHLTSAVSTLGKGVSNMLAGDLQGVGILAGGASGAGGHMLGSLVGGTGKLIGAAGQSVGIVGEGKLGTAKELGDAVNNIAAGNYSAVGTNIGNAAGQVLSHDVQGADVLVNAAGGFFRHSVFDY